MAPPKRPKDVTQCARLLCDMPTGEVPNDNAEILNPPEAPEPEGRHVVATLAPKRSPRSAPSGDRTSGCSRALGEVMDRPEPTIGDVIKLIEGVETRLGKRIDGLAALVENVAKGHNARFLAIDERLGITEPVR